MKTRPRHLLIRASASDYLAIAAAQVLTLPADAAAPLPTEIVWMPAGDHQISAHGPGGAIWAGKVVCDEEGARAVQASFTRTLAAGRRVYLDKNHDDGEATAWVTAFRWDPAQGILATIEWTSLGQQLLRGKVYYSFSPAFLVNKTTGRVSGFPSGHAAGGLVNAPAFGAAMPALIAARLAGAESHSANPAPDGTSGNPPEKHTMKDKLLKILTALGVTIPADASDEQLLALIEQATANKAPDAAMQAKLGELAQLQAKDAARRKADASAAVNAAIARGALPPKDEAVQAKWTNLIEADPTHAQLLASLPDSPALTRVTTPSRQGSSIEVQDNVLVDLRAMHAEKDHMKRGQIYRAVRKFVTERGAEVMPILAANSLGTIAGDLVVLRALDLLKLNFPVLGRISTDFSSEAVRQGQAIKTRIVSVPTVVTLNDSTGWTSSDATTTDVSVTIGQPKGVQISYGSTELGTTSRDLFGEQVEAAHYALAKDLVDALYAVITSGNFSNATTKATASLARADLVAMEKALAARGVEGVRTLLLNADTFEKMSNDTTVVNLAAYQRPEIITGTGLPPLAGFDVIRSINLPATGNLTGFGFRKDALVLATRLPEDYTRAFPGAAHGNVSVVTNPDTGISVQKVDYVDHDLARAFSRIAWSYGVAKGNGSSGQRLISA